MLPRIVPLPGHRRRSTTTTAWQRGSGRRQSGATIPFSSMSRFNLDRESKPKFLSPNYFSTMAEITPTTSVVVELPETSENPTKSFHQMGALRKPYLMLRVTRHNTNSRTVIQITKKCTTLALHCVYSHTHTCGARTVVAHCLIGGPNSLGGQGRERGGAYSLTTTYGTTFQISLPELSFFQRRAGYLPSARFTPIASFSHWGRSAG